MIVFYVRRYVVLTKEYLFTFREEGDFTSPTESIKMDQCCTVKSSDDEINKEFTFVSAYLLGLTDDVVVCRNWNWVRQYFTFKLRVTKRRKVG